ncbi:hypothetical protein BS78_05G191900 [Paspalum vaginatum]|nr:hypothetical protein BS78_05G191900 [Paspalum vaginatum]
MQRREESWNINWVEEASLQPLVQTERHPRQKAIARSRPIDSSSQSPSTCSHARSICSAREPERRHPRSCKAWTARKGMDPALYKAATQGKVASLGQLVDSEDPSRLSSTTPQLNNAVHLAALHGHAEFAGEALDRHEELLVARNDDGDTPLHLAAKAGKLEVAVLHIARAKARPEDEKSPLIMTNKAGNTALHEAVGNRRGAVAVALLDADPTRGHDLNEHMESPLHMHGRPRGPRPGRPKDRGFPLGRPGVLALRPPQRLGSAPGCARHRLPHRGDPAGEAA